MKRLFFFLAIGLTGTSPALAQEDPYQAAVEARLGGDADAAVRLLEPIVAADPANADAQVQLGLAQLARGELDAAEEAFRAAIAVAPGYDDARIGLARAAQRRGDPSAALAALGGVDAAHPDATALRAQLRSGEGTVRWQVDVDASHSALSGPQPDWQEASAQLRYQPNAATALAGRIEYSRRFGIEDVYLEAGLERQLSERARGYVTFGGTVDADFRPRWQLGLGGSLRVRDGAAATVLTLDARQARFAVGDVQSLSPGIEQYLSGRLWLTGRWINLFDESGRHRSGFLVRADVMVADPVRLFAGYSDAPDTDEGRVVPVKSLFGGASIDLASRTSLRVSIAHDDRATGSDRTQFGLGLGLRF